MFRLARAEPRNRDVSHTRIVLTRRAGVNHVETAPSFRRHELENVCLNELKLVMRLWPIIHANDLETGAVVAHRRPTCAAKQV
jgi:hypothetical protein